MQIINNKINIILVLIIIFLSLAQVMILNRDSTAGQNLTSILAEIEKTEETNNKLNQKIASASAIAIISARVKDYGLVPQQQIISFSSSIPIALSERSSL